MVNRILAAAIVAAASMPCQAQTDSVTTVQLRDVVAVGIKQSTDTELGAATLVNAATVDRLNIATMRGVSELAPNFYMPSYGSRITSSIYVRGLGARIDQPVVGLSVDGVPYLNKDNYDFDLFDIAKIEVLRGAQSILNGRNTMGGQVNISTLSPWQYQGWRFMLEYGRANSIKAGAGFYHRISEHLATSATGYYTGTDGFFRNQYDGRHIGTERQGSLRWKMSWHPSSRLSLTNTASAQLSRQGGYPYQSLENGQIAYNDTCYYRRTSVADAVVLGWSGRRVVVTSTTSFQYLNDDLTLDQDFTPKPYFTLTQAKQEWSLTEDLYAKGHRGHVDWLGGVFGFYRHSKMQAPVNFKDQGLSELIEAHPNQMNPNYPIRWDSREFLLSSDFLTITKGAAVYGQATFAAGPWDLQLGLRWDLERATLMYRSWCNSSYTIYHILPDGQREVYSREPVDIDDRGHLSRSFGQFLPKIAIGYNLGDVRLYANVAKGYKAGGFNSQMFSDVLQQRVMALMGLTMQYKIEDIIGYKPEKSWNYEMGVKSKLLGGKLDLDACAFYISCTDQQLTCFPSGLTTGRMMTNAGRTRSYGAELSATWRPDCIWTLQGSYGYTNARFVRYHNGISDFKGKQLPYAPSNTAFASVNCQLPVTLCGASPSICVNCRGVGDIFWDEANTVHQPFYALLGASMALEHDNWSLRLWAENITGTRYDTFYFVSIGHAFLQRGIPCTFGATVRLSI